MKFRKLTAIASALAVLGSVFTAVPLTASAAGETTVLVNDASFSSVPASGYSTDSGNSLYVTNPWLKVQTSSGGNVATGSNAFIITLDSDAFGAGEQLNVSFTASNGNGSSDTGLDVYVENTPIGAVAAFKGNSGSNTSAFSKSVKYSDIASDSTAGIQVYLKVTNNAAKAWIKDVMITKSAASDSILPISDNGFVSGSIPSYYSAGTGNALNVLTNGWLQGTASGGSNVTVNSDAVIINLGSEASEGDSVTVGFTYTNENGSTASGLNVLLEETSIGTIAAAARNKSNEYVFSATGTVPATGDNGAQIKLRVTDGAAKVRFKAFSVCVEHAATPTPTATPTPIPTAAPTATPTAAPAATFTLASSSSAAPVYVDSTGADYDGLSIIANTFAGDVNMVSGQTPSVQTASSADGISGAVIVGVVGDALITSTGIDTSGISGKNEVYTIQKIGDNLVIAGSDKRGAIYGLFHVSEAIGVSPWVYWGDAVPEQKTTVTFGLGEGGYTSDEPSVKYRGIFLNDEAPNLTSWTDGQFSKHFGPQFYGKVFELILRLKGNYLWPAMWSNDFYKEGTRGNSDLEAYKTAMALTQGALANAELADKYGILMGTSHHEPMGRAGNEWAEERSTYMSQYYPNATDTSSTATWDYFKYPNALDAFWTDSYTRSKDYENVVTIGMRGEADSDLGYSLEDSITNLKNVITSQFNIMDTVSGEGNRPPTVLALYKEVEDFWVGKQTKSGVTTTSDNPLKDWTVNGVSPLNDTIILLTNDNFGNVRTLPDPSINESENFGGWGMYYHFDYNGGPRSYRWVSSVQLEKIWQNMTDCYEYGVDDMWIVNVGDLKPHEMEISYFLDLAYDYDAWNDVNKIDDYTKAWTAQQFGYSEVSSDTINEIAQLQSDYLKLNATRRAEIVFPTTYNLEKSNELYAMIARAQDIYERAVALENIIPDNLKDAYYQLVEYPAAGSANVTLMNAYSALNSMFSSSGSLIANKYAKLVEDCIEIDTAMQDRYNTGIASGKWNGMMSNTGLGHIDATNWNLSEWSYPAATYVKPADESMLIVHADGTKTGVKAGGTLTLPTFTSTNKEAYAVTVSNGGKAKLDYTIAASTDWIQLSKANGSVYSGEVIGVNIDWSKLSETSTGTITITSGSDTVTVTVNAEVVSTSGIGSGTFIGKDGIVSIEAEHYTASNGMMVVNNLGKNLSSIKAADYTTTYASTDANAPYAQYKVYAPAAGTYTVTAITGPGNPRTTSDMLSYYVKVNDGSAAEQTSITSAFVAGDSGTAEWSNGVTQNAHISSQNVTLSQGENTITFYPSNSAVVLQKLVIKEGADNKYVQRDGVKDTGDEFIGPEESWYVGASTEQKALVHPTVSDEMNIPGVVSGSGAVIVSEDGTYQITATGATSDAITLTLDNESIALTANEDGYEAELTAGEYELAFTGAASLEFELLNLEPGVVINHPMSTQTEVNAVASGYVNLYDKDSSGNVIPRVVTFDSSGAMKYETTGKYSTSGFKYDITSLIKRVIAEYGDDTEFTLSMDIKSELGSNGTPRIGFMNASTDITATSLADSGVSSSGFTTVTCTSTLANQDKVYFFLYAGVPSSLVKNIKITYPVPVKTELFAHTSGSDWTDYEVFDSTNTEATLNKSGEYMTASFGSNHTWDSNNGVKLDVTDYVQQCDNGGLFGITITFGTFSWSSNNMKACLEYEDGTNKVTLASGVSDDATDYTITGENSYTFDTNEKVYLTITHPSGTHYIHDVTFWGYKTEDAESEKKKTEIFKHTFNTNKKTEAALYTSYEDNGGTVTGATGAALKYNKGTATPTTKGVKINITNMLPSGGSGLTFGASAEMKCEGGGTGAMFFLVDSTQTSLATGATVNGSVTRTDPETSGDLGSNWFATPLSGETVLTYSENDTVYLCITGSADSQFYDDITLYYYAAEEEEEDPTLEQDITDGDATITKAYDGADATVPADTTVIIGDGGSIKNGILTASSGTFTVVVDGSTISGASSVQFDANGKVTPSDGAEVSTPNKTDSTKTDKGFFITKSLENATETTFKVTDGEKSNTLKADLDGTMDGNVLFGIFITGIPSGETVTVTAE